MPITSKDLLEHLSDLQLVLEDYSFEKMTVEEAREVKKSYEVFRKQIETRIWDPACRTKISGSHASKAAPNGYDKALESVANDLRNPLHGIIGFANILSEAPLEEPYKSIASSLYRASETMSDTLAELGVYYRIKNRDDSSPESPFSPAVVLEETKDYARLQLLHKPVNVILDFKSDLHQTVLGNPSDLRRILLNLIENACRFTQSGTIEIRAAISKSKTSPELCIEISDTGIGIPEAELPHIFKPYYQGKQAMDLAVRGTGFGLAIVHQLVAKQSGRIEISSCEGKGSTVRLTLPYTATSKTSVLPNQRNSYKGALSGKRVLIVEPDVMNDQLLQLQLEEMGCVFFLARDFSEAIQMLESHPMDILLAGLRLQNKKDRQGLEQIRNHQNSYIRNFPILGLTSEMTDSASDTLKEYGLDGLLFKPYTEEALFKKIKELGQICSPEALNDKLAEYDPSTEVEMIDLGYLESKCEGDPQSLNILVRALRNGMLEFAGRTRIGLNRRDYASIAEGAERLLVALEMIQAQSLISPVTQIYKSCRDGVDENKIIRAFSVYLSRYPKVADALERHSGMQG